MEKKTKYRLSGVAAGLTNGIFGGGGGIPLLVLLTKWAGVEEKKAFATCVAVIFPMCAVRAGWSADGCSKRCRTSGCAASSRSFCSMAAGAIFSREAER